MVSPVGRVAEIRAVFGNRDLRRCELSWVGSIAGEFAYAVVLAVYAYGEGGAEAVGLVWLLRTIPAAAAAPFVALLADRYRRERVLVAANLARAAATAGTVVAVAADAAWAAYGLSVCVAVLSTLFWPAQAALLPSLARTPRELTAANAASTTLEGLGTFVGPALCGALLAVTSVELAFAAVAVLFVASAAPLAAVATPRPERPSGRGTVLAELGGGVRAVTRSGDLRLLVGVYGVWALAQGALTVLVVVVAIEQLDLGEGGVGLLTAAIGVGGIVGAMVALALVTERNLDRSLVAGALVWSLPISVLALVGEPAAAVALLAVLGVGNIVLDTSLLTLLQRAAPEEVHARVFGLVEALWVGAIGVGAASVPLLIELVGDRGALVLAGLVFPVAALASWRQLGRLAPPASAELDLLRRVPFLATLPQPVLERLAGRLERVEVEPGAAVVRLGEPGDRFYLVAGGELTVAVAGVEPRQLGAGDYFGEIALLHDVPRTATVTAATRADLRALGRDDFLAAVTGFRPSAEAAAGAGPARLGPSLASESDGL
jgi:MFS family permease